MSVLDPYDLEMHLLSAAYRLRTQARDRRGSVELWRVDPETGIPLSSKDMVGRKEAKSGLRLALEHVFTPLSLATGLLRRDLGEDGIVALGSLPQKEWSAQEHEWVDALVEQIQVKVHQLSSQGYFRASVDVEGYGLGEDRLSTAVCKFGRPDLTHAFQVTARGLEYAKQRVRGTRWERGPLTLREDVGETKWRNAPEHAKAYERSGDLIQ